MAEEVVTKETIAADIAKFVTSQGNQAGLEGLDKILADILSIIPDED